MYEVEFNITGHKAKTLEPEYIGEHDGWIVAGEIHEDYYKWVNEFTARKIGSTEWVRGNFETTVTASSKKAYDEFVSLFPPIDWDYWDI